MPLSNRYSLPLAALLLLVSGGASAQVAIEDRPAVIPAHPLTPAEKNRRQALALYAKGIQCERNNLFLEATRTFEEAAKLDPDSAAIRRSLVPLYLALDRLEDALKTCRRILEIDPDDHETWYLYSRQLKDQGKPKEAKEALARAAAGPRLKDHFDQKAQICFDLAVLCEDAKEFDKALEAYRRVIEVLDHPDALLELGNLSQEDLDAKAAETYERIGRLALQLKRFDEAVAAFQKAQQKDPVRANRLNLNLAKVRQSQEKPDEALHYLDEYLKTQPPGAEGYDLKIALLSQSGKENQILPMLHRAVEADKHNLALKLLYARQCGERGASGDAIREFKELAGETPTAEVYAGMFRVYRQTGRMAEALATLDAAVLAAHPHRQGKQKPEGSAKGAAQARAIVQALRDDAELTKAILPEAARKLQSGQAIEGLTEFYLAVLAKRAGCLDDAEKLFDACLRNSSPYQEHQELAYQGLLEILWEGRKYQAMVDLCEKGLRGANNTHRLMFHRMLSLAYVRLENPEKALEHANEGVNISEEANRLNARMNKVDVLRQLDRYDEAVAECQALFKEYRQPNQVRDIRYELSNIYSGKHDQEKAEEQLQLILKADPDDATACNDLGYLWAEQGKHLSKAEDLIRKALRLDQEQRRAGPKGDASSGSEVDGEQDRAAYVDSLGWVLFRRGQLQNAREQLERATTLNRGDDPVIWDHLGDVYLRLDQRDKARKAWQKSLDLYESEKRRKLDDQYKELKNKLKLLEE